MSPHDPSTRPAPTPPFGGADPVDPAALVTGDAVVLDVRLAALPSRTMAIAIDITVQVVLIAVLGALLTLPLDAAALGAASLLIMVGVILGYPVAVETLTRGRTLGKLALGLRVVRDDGGPVRFRQALIRGLAEVVEIWLTMGVIAVLCSLVSEKGKRFGDVLAGTVVVRERVPAQGGRIATMPPQLVAWAASADLARVPDDLALSARQLLARWDDLDPAARHRMSVDLATRVGRFVAPASPPGTPAPDYLAAVLAERRRRESYRLAGQPVAARAPAPPPHPMTGHAPAAPQHPAAPHHAAPEPPAPAQGAPDGFAPPT